MSFKTALLGLFVIYFSAVTAAAAYDWFCRKRVPLPKTPAGRALVFAASYFAPLLALIVWLKDLAAWCGRVLDRLDSFLSTPKKRRSLTWY